MKMSCCLSIISLVRKNDKLLQRRKTGVTTYCYWPQTALLKGKCSQRFSFVNRLSSCVLGMVSGR